MVRRFFVLVVAIAAGAAPAGAQVRADERVDVARVLVDARVTGPRGEPVRGLAAGDFRAQIDGRDARIESATWIGLPEAAPGGAAAPADFEPHPQVSVAGGRWTVFLFQHSLEPSRVGGLLRMMRESARFVDRFAPGDRAAVVVFDSRLRLYQDFTADRRRLADVLGRGLFFGKPDPAISPGISLAATLVSTAAERASTLEQALTVVARALSRIEGGKSLVLMGHGFGRFQAILGSATGMAVLDRDYDEAREALLAARVAVFAMDVTDADTHTLETGLMAAAEDTGGFYAKVHERQSAAMDRLASALEGYYLLSVEKPPARKGRHDVLVRATARGATVSARRYYID